MSIRRYFAAKVPRDSLLLQMERVCALSLLRQYRATSFHCVKRTRTEIENACIHIPRPVGMFSFRLRWAFSVLVQSSLSSHRASFHCSRQHLLHKRSPLNSRRAVLPSTVFWMLSDTLLPNRLLVYTRHFHLAQHGRSLQQQQKSFFIIARPRVTRMTEPFGCIHLVLALVSLAHISANIAQIIFFHISTATFQAYTIHRNDWSSRFRQRIKQDFRWTSQGWLHPRRLLCWQELLEINRLSSELVIWIYYTSAVHLPSTIPAMLPPGMATKLCVYWQRFYFSGKFHFST